ncbi:hypothetical protein SNEBB_001567 [Seison nebaliae]|nr:hypothetical protein SNEBB_001567 [Seison nebaliae]
MSTVENGSEDKSQHGDHGALPTDRVITELQKMQTLLMNVVNRIDKLEENRESVIEVKGFNKETKLTEQDLQSTKTLSSINAMAKFGEKLSANCSLKILDVVESRNIKELNLNLYDWKNSMLLVKMDEAYSLVLGIEDQNLLVHFTTIDTPEFSKSLIPNKWKIKGCQLNVPNVRSDKIVIALIRKISSLVKYQDTKCLVGRDGKWLLPITSALNTMDEMEVESIFDYLMKIFSEELGDNPVRSNQMPKEENNEVSERLIVGNLTPPLRHMSESFVAWIKRLKLYLSSNRIPIKLHFNILWNALSNEERATVDAERLKEKCEFNNFEETVRFLSVKSMRLHPLEEFNQLRREPNESVAMFHSRIKSISEIAFYDKSTEEKDFIMRNQNLAFVEVEIGSRKVEALIDGGAECSTINRTVLRTVKLFESREIQTEISGVTSGNSIPITELITTKIIIGETNFTCNFHVTDNFKYEMILGGDFLSSQNMAVDYWERNLIFITERSESNICAVESNEISATPGIDKFTEDRIANEMTKNENLPIDKHPNVEHTIETGKTIPICTKSTKLPKSSAMVTSKLEVWIRLIQKAKLFIWQISFWIPKAITPERVGKPREHIADEGEVLCESTRRRGKIKKEAHTKERTCQKSSSCLSLNKHHYPFSLYLSSLYPNNYVDC